MRRSRALDDSLALASHERGSRSYVRQVAGAHGKLEPPSLGRAERDLVRRLIDAATRARIAWDSQRRCVGCGVEIIDLSDGRFRYVAGCRTCADRRAKHRRRINRS